MPKSIAYILNDVKSDQPVKPVKELLCIKKSLLCVCMHVPWFQNVFKLTAISSIKAIKFKKYMFIKTVIVKNAVMFFYILYFLKSMCNYAM